MNMKKLLTLFSLSCLTLGSISAQNNADKIISTFEDGDNGLTDTTPWCDGNLFEMGAQIMNNPETGGINNSEKCFGAVFKPNGGWWGAWTYLELEKPVVISEEQPYLKMMVYRSVNRGGMSIGINNNDPWEKSFSTKADGVWEDIIFDLTDKIGTELSTLVILHQNWDGQEGPQATYLYDNVVMSDNLLPRGVELVDGKGFNLSFQQQKETDKWIKNIEIFSDEINSYEIVDNPTINDDLNKTSKVFKFDKGNCDWWHGGPKFNLNGLIELGEENELQYMHVAVNVPETAFNEDGICTVQLCAWDHLGRESNQTFNIFEGDDNMWHDLVFSLTDELNYITNFSVRFDIRKDNNDNWIKSPEGVFYLDEIAISNLEEERILIEDQDAGEGNSVSQTGKNSNIVYNTKRGLNITVANDALVDISSVSGINVKRFNAKANETTVISSLPQGVYLIKINDTQNNKDIIKVIVK